MQVFFAFFILKKQGETQKNSVKPLFWERF